MEWLHAIEAEAARLPAVWLIGTGARPRTLPERSALRRETARAVIAHRLGLAPAEIAIAHEAAGRPFLLAPGGSGLHLSLATRDGLVAVALGVTPIGVDVERIATGAEMPLAMLHPAERLRLDGMAPDRRAAAFGRLWAAKEAYVKALGAGFSRAPESFAVTPEDEGRFRVDDPRRAGTARGHSRIVDRGGHGAMAAAVVAL